MNSTVYVFASPNGRFNTAGAVTFGQVRYCSPEGRVSMFNTDAGMAFIEERLEDFDPDTDFIAMTGQNVIVALALSYVMAKFGRCRILLFDARTAKYAERTVHHPSFSREVE
tara:strand:+ start:3185 stop:3520 length:336 start_codon:yes stop_codon:yes gene_type:complete